MNEVFVIKRISATICTFRALESIFMPSITVDRYDLALLDALQHDAHTTNTVLGEQAHLSASQVSRRVQRLEEAGVISGYAALLDPTTIGLGVTAYAHINLERHGGSGKGDSRTADFEAAVAAMPEVLECFSVTGEADYILRIVAPDLASFSETMMQRLLTLPGVAQVKTNIALTRVKESHVLPLDHVTRPTERSKRISFSG